jgi:hypothetical protein
MKFKSAQCWASNPPPMAVCSGSGCSCSSTRKGGTRGAAPIEEAPSDGGSHSGGGENAVVVALASNPATSRLSGDLDWTRSKGGGTVD